MSLKDTLLVKPGKNTLEIEVVSTWNNRLVKDQRLKEGERKTWLTFNPFKSDTPLVKSGLIGPVRIETIAEQGLFNSDYLKVAFLIFLIFKLTVIDWLYCQYNQYINKAVWK